MAGGWDAVAAAVAAARAEVAAVSPDAATAVEGEAYVMRILTTCLSDAFLGHMMVRGGLSRALPTRGGPNPDYAMDHAGLDAAHRYRLEGKLNASERVGVGIYSFGAGGSSEISAYSAIDATSVDEEGRFAIDVAADATGPGTLAITPGDRVVLIRTLHRDPDGEPASLRWHGGQPVRDLTLAQGNVEAALGQVAQGLRSAITTFLEWTAVTSASPNRFQAETPRLAQGVQGDPDTIYYLGYYQLQPDQWLEVTLPGDIAGYWSLHAYNHWAESLPGAGVGNDTAIVAADGQVHTVIGSQPPSDAANRIDTLGRLRGLLIFRAIGAGSVAAPQAEVRSSASFNSVRS